MSEITLATGEVVLVDDADYVELNRYKWQACPSSFTTYALRTVHRGDGSQTTVTMHRLLMGEPECDVDHRNGNGLDNRRSNLRLATRSQNQANRRPLGSTGFKGVSRTRKRFMAQGRKDGKQVYLGTYDTPEEAAHAYDEWAVGAHGEFARPNFPRAA